MQQSYVFSLHSAVLWSFIVDICIQIIHQSFSFKTLFIWNIYEGLHDMAIQSEIFMQSKVVELHVITLLFP